jgi:thymidine kinase
MAKLFFRFGTMSSGKSLDLLKVAFNYEENGLTSIILTSKIDNRYGNEIVQSRTGLKKEAIGIDNDINIFEIIEYKKTIIGNNIGCVLVDEVQFFNKQHIDQLIHVVDSFNIPVICYGLRSNFKLEPFETTAYLMSVADEIEEIKTICSECTKKKAIVNARFNDKGKVTTSGELIEIGGNEKYRPLCRKCFNKLKK